jgi:glutaminyl-tRNA synthetase
VLNTLDYVEPPKQREFGRLNLTGVVTSKRYLRQLVFGNYVDGWDDPRMVTVQGMRRRGFTPESIKRFCDEIGIAKVETTIDISLLEHCLREDLKPRVLTAMAVLRPLKVVITNYPEDTVEMLSIPNNSENEAMGSRDVPFTKVLYIEETDFMENPVKGYNRLAPGVEVRLKGGYFIKCEDFIKDENGNVVELRCTYDPATRSGSGFEGRKVKGTIHWVSAEHAVDAEVHLYEKLMQNDDLLKDDSIPWEEKLNPESLIVLKNCKLEPALADAPIESKYQFIRNGYFCVDSKYTKPGKLVFNRIVPLKDSWNKK